MEEVSGFTGHFAFSATRKSKNANVQKFALPATQKGLPPLPRSLCGSLLGLVLDLGSVAHDEPLAVLANHLGEEPRFILVGVGGVDGETLRQVGGDVEGEFYLLVVLAACRFSGDTSSWL